MTDSIFRKGTLELPVEITPGQPAPESLTGIDVNGILVVVSVVLVLLSLKSFLRVFPHIMQSLGRSKGCVNLEHSYSMAHLRDVCAAVMVLPFCLIADKCGFLSVLFGWDLPRWAGVPAALCVLVSYFLIRYLMFRIACPKRMDYDFSRSLNRCLYTFFIVLCLVLLASQAVFIVFDVPSELCFRISAAEIILFYLFSLLRSVQFLSAYCNGFATILYLCALEIVPLAAVAAICTFLKI